MMGYSFKRLGYIVEKRFEVWLNNEWNVYEKQTNSYNIEGRLIQSQNLKGETTTHQWDCCSKTSTTYPDGSQTFYTY